ncbi:histo-blood group ABO system transferase 1-like [Crocuta crocuta]
MATFHEVSQWNVSSLSPDGNGDGDPVTPQGVLQERTQWSERDCPPDTCRVPEVPRLDYPKAQLLQPARTDVLVMTPWFAPIVWDGVFDSVVLDAQFKNTSIGLTVFAIKN